jgi:hypothetical protein
MQRFLSKTLFYMGFASAAFLSMATGCASGGYKLTRQYAGWVNSQNVILRVIIYILTMVVFAVTILIDTVVFNTMDFWNGRVSQGDYNFKDGEKTYFVRHEILPGSGLKRSTIQVSDLNGKHLQEVVLSQTPQGEIIMTVDGVERTKVKDITGIPVASIYGADGKLVEQKALWFTGSDSLVAQSK